MGLAGLVVREVVKFPATKLETLGTSLVLKAAGLAIGFILIVGYAVIFADSSGLEFWILLVVSSAIFFQPFDVIDYWFQAQVQAKHTAIARSCATLLGAAIKVALVATGAGIIYFAFAHMLQAALGAIFLIILYRFVSKYSILEWKASFKKAGELLKQGWVIYLGSIFAVIYIKVDQVMLKWLVGAEEVGIYSVAAQLSEAWYFVPTAIVASFFPKLIELHATNNKLFNDRLQQIFDFLFILALAVSAVVTLISEPLIRLFFGESYIDSAPILSIHVWAGVFIFMRALFSRWILIENALMFSLITQGLGALANVLLNLLLIPDYGGKGAAIATLLSYSLASYGALFLHKKTRPIFYMMTKSILSPLRYTLAFARNK
ncbi:colanic acid exporter [compost metagenome]